MSRKILALLSLLIIASFMLSACQGTTVTPQATALPDATDAPADQPAATEPPAVEVAPTEVPPTPVPSTDRKGGWLDTLVYTSIDQIADAVTQLKADALDIYPFGSENSDAFLSTESDPNLAYTVAIGNSVDGYMFNPAGPTFVDGRLNPFSNPKVREAVNWLIDRNYVAQEAIGAMGQPQTVVIVSTFPDYVRYADIIRPLEVKYAYNLDKAKAAITAEMEAMGATMGADGKWQFNGAPVVLIGLIRSEDERTFMGNYLSDQLENIGFTVERQVRTRTELSPIWGRSVPAEGQWHFYTAGWGYNAIARNSSNLFDGYYTTRAGSTTAEQGYVVSPEFDQLSMDLANNKYANMDERREMFARALELSLQESQMVWVAGVNQFYPRNANLQVSSDMVAGVAQSALYPYTLRWKGEEGGTVRLANQGILTGAWNPISGQNWVQEVVVQKSTTDDAVLSDPYTGLYWPQRLERAEVVAVEGLPMSKTLDWVDLTFAPQIQVPPDAWSDWDAAAQEFVPASTKYPDGATALCKITVYYPAELWNVKWHDGSTLSTGDFVNNMIRLFDRAKPESPLYDEAAVPNYESFMSYFKGVKIVSTNPLVIETYVDTFDLDAEVLIGLNPFGTWFPTNRTNAWSAVSWHAFVPGMLAEQNLELAFSEEKSTSLNVNWTHYIDGPSLEILKKYLDQAAAETFIPYAPTLGQFITAEEAATRYTNLQAWYDKHNHFWVGTGPYYLDQVNSVEGSIVTKHNDDFPDPSNKWDRFGEPMLPVVDVTGPAKVTIGKDAAFDILVSFKDAPYPNDSLDSIPFLLYDAEGNLLDKGKAEFVAEGQYVITLPPEMTSKLKEGTAQLEIIAVSNVISVPVFSRVTFVVGK